MCSLFSVFRQNRLKVTLCLDRPYLKLLKDYCRYFQTITSETKLRKTRMGKLRMRIHLQQQLLWRANMKHESGSRPSVKTKAKQLFWPHSETCSNREYARDATWKLSIHGVSRHAKTVHLPIPASLTVTDCAMRRSSTFLRCFSLWLCRGRSSDALVVFQGLRGGLTNGVWFSSTGIRKIAVRKLDLV